MQDVQSDEAAQVIEYTWDDIPTTQWIAGSMVFLLLLGLADPVALLVSVRIHFGLI